MSELQQRNKPPFRYDIVGSFLRPDVLKEARNSFSKGELSAEDLKAVEDSAIIDLVKKQKDVGLKAITDGEFRRSWWHLDFMWGFDGVERAFIEQGYQFHGIESRPETSRLSGKIGFTGHPFLKHYEFLKKIAGDDCLAKQCIPSPAQLFAELIRDENRESIDKNYKDFDELKADITTAYSKVIKAFYDLGCRNVQFDDCTWGLLCDSSFREYGKSIGIDPEETADLYAELNNKALENLPEDLVITTHVCRGNYRSTWAMSGGYEPVAEALFGKENVDGYLLEFDTDRSGGFEPLKEVSGDKIVVLGLVSSKIGELESRDEILRRIDEASKYVPLERLCLSPQCGFASTEEGNLLTEQQQWDKLKLVKNIAEEVWS